MAADYGKRLRRKVLGVPLECEMRLKIEEGVQGEEVSRDWHAGERPRIPKNRDSAAEVLTFSNSEESTRQTPNGSPDRAPTRASTRASTRPKLDVKSTLRDILALLGGAWSC